MSTRAYDRRSTRKRTRSEWN